MDRIGTIFYRSELVGTIAETSNGFRFSYDPLWKRSGFPIGFGFPLMQDLYYCSTLFPFLENMLREGWLRGLQSQQEQIDTTDSFGLLLANGEDLPGAFTIREVKR